MLDRNTVGRSTPPTLHEVEKGAIRRFAQSLGDLNPLYLEPERALAAGLLGVLAPPTFPESFSAAVDLGGLLGVAAERLSLAELTLEYERPIVAGDRLFVVSRVAEASEKDTPEGLVDLAVVEEEGCDEAGTVVYRARRTFIVRPGQED